MTIFTASGPSEFNAEPPMMGWSQSEDSLILIGELSDDGLELYKARETHG